VCPKTVEFLFNICLSEAKILLSPLLTAVENGAENMAAPWGAFLLC
jgi:hypothetical protein